METPLVSIIILNYNGKKWLEQFLPTCILTTYPNTQWIVADNASTDDSVAYVKSHFPSMEVVQLPQNYGFAEGNNQTIPFCKGEYVVLLNSDVEVTPHWLEPLVSLAEKNAVIGAIQPKILSYYQKTHFEYAGASGGYLDKYAIPFCRGRIFEVCEEDTHQYDEAAPIFWATGACLFSRKSVWDAIGGLDADFFAHMEEIDWCWRLQLAGYECWCEPQSVVYHVGGGTLPKTNAKKTFLNVRNSLWMIYKNIPKHQLIKVLLKRWAIDCFAAGIYLLTGKFSLYLAIVKAHLHVLGSLRKVHKKRKQIQNMVRQKVSLYPIHILNAYYLKKRKTFSALDTIKKRQ